MWVPGLAETKSGEVGHPNYQHPQRLRDQTYSIEVDRFPLLLVATSLRALKAKGKALWDKYDNGDNLLFKESDLREPGQSDLFRELPQLGDCADGRRLTGNMLKAVGAKLESTPLLEELTSDAKATAVRPGRRPSRKRLRPRRSPPSWPGWRRSWRRRRTRRSPSTIPAPHPREPPAHD